MRNIFVGRGVAFPMRVDPNGSMALVADDREIEEGIRVVLSTSPGERPMRPHFGCAIHEHIFDVVTPTLMASLRVKIMDALRLWEPRISVSDVLITLDDDDRSLIFIDIHYAINANNSERNLVFPFYTIPAE